MHCCMRVYGLYAPEEAKIGLQKIMLSLFLLDSSRLPRKASLSECVALWATFVPTEH